MTPSRVAGSFLCVSTNLTCTHLVDSNPIGPNHESLSVLIREHKNSLMPAKVPGHNRCRQITRPDLGMGAGLKILCSSRRRELVDEEVP